VVRLGGQATGPARRPITQAPVPSLIFGAASR